MDSYLSRDGARERDSRGVGLSGIPSLDSKDLEGKLDLEARHWWYRGRRAVLRSALGRLGLGGGEAVLDAGCGTGHNVGVLGTFGRVVGADINPQAVRVARRRGVDAHCASVEQLPFSSEQFDFVACLDVLEHVQDDAAALSELRRVTRPGGVLVLTVPAWPALFGEHDRAAGHLRRYRAQDLLDVSAVAGWRRLVLTHFNSLLFPAAAVHRWLRRTHTGEAVSDLVRTPAGWNEVLSWPMRLEARIVGAGIDLPFGLSILLGLVKA
jgi:SAM-dependent methyltransferase